MFFFPSWRWKNWRFLIISFLYRKSYICWIVSEFSKMPTITEFPRLFQPIASHVTIWQNINNWKKNPPEIYPKVWRLTKHHCALHLTFCKTLQPGFLSTVKWWMFPQWHARGSLTHYLERVCGSFLGLVFCLRNDLTLYFNFSL